MRRFLPMPCSLLVVAASLVLCLTVATPGTALAASPTGSISGTVTDSNGHALQGICVYINDSYEGYGSAVTAQNGSYAISDLPSGRYTVEFFPCDGAGNYLTQYYDDVTNETEATLVKVTAGHAARNIDDALATGGQITGTVTDTLGNDLSGICVSAASSDGGYGYSSTARTGSYTISDLPTGSYTVTFSDCGGGQYHQTQYYDNVTSMDSAIPVSVTAGQITSGIGDAMGPTPSYTLWMSESGNGSGVITDGAGDIECPGQCWEQGPPGTEVTLRAKPYGGSTFTGWSVSDGSCPGTGSCTITLNGDTTVTATFSRTPVPSPTPGPGSSTLSVVTAGAGSGTVTGNGIDCPGTCSQTYTNGTSVTLTAAPASGSAFAGWLGGGCSGTGTCTVSLAANENVTATFNAAVTSSGSGSAEAALTAKLQALLNSILAPHGPAAKLSRIVKSRDYVVSVSSPVAATVTIKWYELHRGAHLARNTKGRPVLIASGSLTLPAAGAGKLELKLTAPGRRLLEHASRIKLTSQGGLSRTGAATLRATKTITLKR